MFIFKNSFYLLLIVLLTFSCGPNPTTSPTEKTDGPKVILVIHGGAGNVSRDRINAATDSAYREALKASLLAGYEMLQNGAESCEAIMKAIKMMEDNPLFNAGKGAVLTAEGECELDASIMRGSDRNAGAVAGVKSIKNPIDAAYEVMVNSEHVMLSGAGADKFGSDQGLALEEADYFKTARRVESLEHIKKLEKEYGTVGAVALDEVGNLCAGTSTGGMTNKKWGRIGDAPIIGAGTYANNETCGISCTGHGEYFIRSATAYEVSALMAYKNYSLKQAADSSINQTYRLGGEGGLIALDRQGNVAMPFSSSGMFRGYVTEDGEIVVKLYGDE